MIRSIFVERYKKALIAACLLVIGLSVCTALVQNNQWKNLYNNPSSRIDFESNRNEYTYYDEGEMDFVPYKSYKEYRDATLLFYNVYSGYSDFSIKTMSKAENYSNRIPYSSSVGHFYIGLSLLLIVPLLGFLLFFIDQKTGFNQFLFSLPLSRKDLFKSKIIYVAIPFLLSILVGQSLYACLIHTLIPAPYMNATLGQLFISVLSNFCLLLIMFCSSAFIGAMVGNIIFGPLTWIVYWCLMNLLPKAVYSLGNIIYTANTINHKSFSETLFVFSVGKMGGHWWINLIFIISSILLLFWCYKHYQTLSLENDTNYLLYKKARWPIWMIITVFTSFILNMTFFNSWMFFLSKRIYEQTDISIVKPVLTTFSVTLIVACICGIIVFFADITKNLSRFFNKLTHQTR
ncbi:ABC transporter permease [Enterococcus avium]|uniref:ABC transporter permease n=1 Tax=Enterococcus avium TaxID=33945 RepID=UPI00288CD202|nr:ABC transporter permease [Enterococcus avium]MDT2469435.1 ABC transporter permease [Enterococcus avium]